MNTAKTEEIGSALRRYAERKGGQQTLLNKTVIESLWVDHEDGTRSHFSMRREMTPADEQNGRISAEDRNGKFELAYQQYIAAFHRWDKRLAWLRFMTRQPIASVGAMLSGKPVPQSYLRQPMTKINYLLR